MAVDSVRQGTVSQDIRDLAAALMARERQPIQLLEARRNELSQRQSVLNALKTRLSALRTSADNLSGVGTLSPFAAKVAGSSDTNVLGASATASAAAGALAVTVQQLARRATHASDVFTDVGTAISSGGVGTFNFTVTIAGVAHAVSVTVAAGETDKTVLDNIATAITAAVASAGSTMRIQTETGKSRLSVASGATGTSNKLTFTDTDGLLARIGLYKASPTAATDTTGGYVYEDLGGHELDSKLLVDGFTYYRESNDVSDLVGGVTLNLKTTSATQVNVKIGPDSATSLDKLKDFITKYNDVLDYLNQNTFVDAKAGTRGVLRNDPLFAGLAGQMRNVLAQRVSSQPSGTVDQLGVLGVVTDRDGKLSIKNEAELKGKLESSPAAVATLFNATDGLATRLESFVESFTKTSGQIATSQNQLTLRINGFNSQIDRMNALLDKRQAKLEDQLARNQAILQNLARQQSFIASITGLAG